MSAETLNALTGLIGALSVAFVAVCTVWIQVIKAQMDARVILLDARVASLAFQLVTETEARRISDAAKDTIIANLEERLREAGVTIQGLVQQVSALQIALATKTAQVEETKPVT